MVSESLGPSQEHLGVWHPWTPHEVYARLQNIAVPWFVVGGWAIDLLRGEQTRAHEDIEIAIPRPCFGVVRQRFGAFRHFSVGDGHVAELPEHSDPPPDKHQNWVLDEATGAWCLDIFLEPSDAETWVYRRDERLRRPRSQMISVSTAGVPYLNPEGVLLFKARHLREKDEADFAGCAPLMSGEARHWLHDALGRAHPGHPWLQQLR